MFVHSDLWHILANMFTLYFFGRALLGLVGQGRFLIVYFVGGLLASICYIVLTLIGGISGIAFLGSPFIPVVGASGAVFAIAGALVAMTPRLPVIIFPIPIPMQLWIAVISIFVIFSIFGIFDVFPIAWQAHLGGLLVGLIAGYIFRRRRRYFL
jgi:membrane associated rhomboid family serine protease